MRVCGRGSRALASEAPQALQASDVKPSYLLHELHSNGTSSVICLYPGLASYVWFKELADAAVDFLATWLQHVPFDGVYLDGFVNANLFANGRAAELKGMVVDSNGDGKADRCVVVCRAGGHHVLRRQAHHVPLWFARRRTPAPQLR